ncbi:PAS domain-containing protein [Nodosilinea sp. LEGE 06152]|uniref:hybrid sensor histidine kinase/response regulator n=1 Tax=Nodosilinea sp. LEGE 06152 TaxID=2777966 RepID=UPI00187E1932|nr:PAS domain-containing protein [Nodosilinea sp. LEGE 06152]MBE9155291.1 PAS domain-containing protein [Nodosilinea sp. LEGE 06152]
MTPQGVAQDVFVAENPVAALMRSRDWSQTSLGEAASWPGAIKTTLGILLSAETPMGCVWGRDRRVFYNEACAALLPAQAAMGQPLGEAEGWAVLGATVEQVFATGRSHALEAAPETPQNANPWTANPLMANHSWACSAVWTETDQVGGVLAIAIPRTKEPGVGNPPTQQVGARDIGVDLRSGQLEAMLETRDFDTKASAKNGASGQGHAALRESEERFRHLANNISQLAWMADANGSVFWYNQRWFDFTGTTLEQMQGWGWRQIHHPNHIDRVVEKVSHCFATGEVWEDTFPLRGKNGQYRWFLSRAIPVRDDRGRVLRWVGTNTDITELRHTEKALEQTTKRLNVALKSVPITLFSQDHQLRYTWVYNPTHNYTPSQMLGRRDDDLVSGHAAARLRQLKQQVLDTGVGLRAAVEVDQAIFDLTIDPIRDRHDRIVGLTGAAVDISDRARLEAEHKQAAATLRKSEEQLRLAQRAAGVGLWDWDMVANEVTWSEEYYNLYGIEPDVVPSYENWLACVLPIDRSRVGQEVQAAIEQGKNLKVNFRIDHPDEGQRWIMVRGQTFYDADHSPIRMAGIAINITEQKRFEQALIESEAIARTRAEELATLMETAPAAIWIAHDANCHQITANRMAHELMQTEPGSLTTATPPPGTVTLPFKQCRQGQEVPPQDLPMQKAIRTGQEVTDQIEFVYLDGTVRSIYGKAVPLFGPNGVARGAIGGFTEITSLKQSEQEREQLLQRERVAREEAEQANRLKDQFLAVLSHELRSPLNPILGWSKLLQTRSFDSEKTKRALATIERNAQLQAQLVDDLLDLARILRGKLHLTPMTINLAGVVESALETVKTAAAAKSIALQLDLDRTVRVAGDAARLQQIVGNLLSNAVKFTPDAGQITVMLRSLRDQAEISVQDTGIGISPNFLPHLFESFRQEDISITRKHGGLGLGLAIVRQLVDIHGGTITAHSLGEGQGATFSVRLPQLAPEVEDDPAAALPQPALDLSGIRVFSVDDSADTREFLTVLLGQYGAEVVTVGSATEALEKIKTWPADVLISDIGMPEIDGYSLIQQIRALPSDQGGNIPAIALTAYARYEDQQQSLASGYQRHLTKPLDLEKLVQAIIELTRGRS